MRPAMWGSGVALRRFADGWINRPSLGHVSSNPETALATSSVNADEILRLSVVYDKHDYRDSTV